MIDYDEDIDFPKLIILFNNIIGTNEDITNEKIEQILQSFYSFRRHEIQGYSTLIKQLHILQLFAKVLFDRNRSSNLTILYNTITVFLNDTRTFLYKLNKQIYLNIKDKTNDLTEYYLVFFNNSEFIFQKDCLDIFFKTTFLDIDVLDYQSVIANELSNIYYEYLKLKTNGNLKFEDANLIDPRYSIRDQIYEGAFRQCKIRELIGINPNSKIVLKSYYKFKNKLLGNELQKFYVNFSNILPNDKELALITDTERIKDKQPLVYQIISALHIDCNMDYSSEYNIRRKNLLYKTIYESLYIEFINLQSEDICKQLCNNIAVNMTNSLCSGYYINPVTLKRINVFNSLFICQLKEFITEVFQDSVN
jgi:hypothetical protein